MRTLSRTLLVTLALLTSGAVQLAAAEGSDDCCVQDDAQSPECPPAGSCCDCCPVRAARTSASPDVAPANVLRVAVVVTAAEPLLGPSPDGIFQPPRG
jgi:hypothetical protein